MTILKKVEQTKNQIAKLQAFVDLVESYQPETLEQQIIKEYAYLGSLVKVVEKFNRLGYTIDGRPYEGEDISSVIKGKGKGNDELHKVMRSGYLHKTRQSRRKIKEFY